METYNSDRYSLFAFAPSILLISCHLGLFCCSDRASAEPSFSVVAGKRLYIPTIHVSVILFPHTLIHVDELSAYHVSPLSTTGFLDLSVRNGCEPVYRQMVSKCSLRFLFNAC
jgi:hypothetical protein